MLKLGFLAQRVPRAVWQYGLAVVSVGGALGVTDLLEHYTTLRTPLFYIAIIISAWFGGMGPGLLSVALSTLAVDYYFAPGGWRSVLSIDDWPFILLFLLSGLLACWITVQRRNAEEALKRARDELEARVAERTSDLRQASEGLQAEIAERKRGEEVLRERANLLDLTHDTVFVRDRNDVITYWNRGAEELYGWSREEAVGKVSHQLTRTIFPAPLEEINAELLRTGRWEGELIHTKRDGTQVIVASRWSMQQDEQGRPLATLETNNDITDRKRGEQALREQARLLDLTHDTVFVRDRNDVITYWNRGAEELYGWSREEAVGKVSHQLMRTIFPAPLEEINAELLRTGRWEGELIHTKRDGTQVIVASRWSMQQDEQGRPLATLETNNDITERKRAEEALNKAQAELAHVARVTTLGEMTASIAHEINQPLAAVVNNASAGLRWLAANNLEEARQSIELIIADGHRAGEIINRIRALAKKTPPQKDRVNINETILEVVALARNEIQKNRVLLQTQLSSDLPLILGDRIQLQQVILNLIINAIEAMSGGGENARDLLVGSGKDESQGVRVAVRDSGPGLDPESLNYIFTAFYTTKPQGMGMGLAISRSIIEAHGGELWAVPNDGPGVTFEFALPVEAAGATSKHLAGG